MSLAEVLEVADAVLYEGYLLYPYRSTSAKNQLRWQFGVLGPPGAAAAGLGEEPALRTECLLQPAAGSPSVAAGVSVLLRFLQLQVRTVERRDGSDGHLPARQLEVDGKSIGSWDEAVECHLEIGRFSLAELQSTVEVPVRVDGCEHFEQVADAGEPGGRVARRRWPLRAAVQLHAAPVPGDAERVGAWRLCIEVANVADTWGLPGSDGASREDATRVSLLGAHLVLQAHGAAFVSLLEPPPDVALAATDCRQHRCWPVLAGAEGSTDCMLVSPIILYDYPAVAAESPGALFDSTEIDEILTLRVLTLTDDEKAEARATDPAAAAIIDRCEQMSPEDMQRLHGVMRDPHAGPSSAPATARAAFDPGDIPTFGSEAPWWDPAADSSASPSTDVVVVDGVALSKGSSVLLHPRRNADAQDLFYAGRVATVAAVLADVDGGTYVAVVIDDDPAADLHEWYGRYLYFAPDEVEPLRSADKEAVKRRKASAHDKEDA